jgi:hypothetical protein
MIYKMSLSLNIPNFFEGLGKSLEQINTDFQQQFSKMIAFLSKLLEDVWYTVQQIFVTVMSTIQFATVCALMGFFVYMVLYPENILPNLDRAVDIAKKMKPENVNIAPIKFI